MGKVYKHYPVKPLFIGGIAFFEIGSAICGAAPSSAVLIFGRAVAGFGASGMMSGVMVIMFHTIPVQQRPAWQGLFGIIFAIGSVIGPLVGGALTNNVTWRWCFYLNLPVGAVSILVILLILHIPNQKLEKPADTIVGKILQLDVFGNLVFFPGIICLVLALQWGGTKYAWADGRIIALLVVFAIFFLAFVAVQVWKQEDGTVPPRIVKNRSVLAGLWYALLNGAGMMSVMYYLPIYFQAIKGVDAVTSGVMLLPTVLATVVSSVASGILVTKLGYYAPFFILSSLFMPIAAGLFTTLTVESGRAQWIGYQVIFGLGVGFGMQQPLNVVQTVLDRADIATGAALVAFLRFLGSAVCLPIAQNVFLNRLVADLSNLPSVHPEDVIKGGLTELRHLVPAEDLPVLLRDYNGAVVHVFYIVVVTSCLTAISSLLVEWKTVKPKNK